MRFYSEYYAIKVFLFLTSFIPVGATYTLCKSIAHLLFKLDKRRRKLTLSNLKLAFPEKSEQEREQLAQKAYESVAITLAETLLMYNERFDIDAAITNKDDILKQLEHHLKNNPRGTILPTGHFSNWELLAQFVAKNGYPFKNIARRGNNHLVDEHIIQAFRGRYGNNHIYKKNAIVSLVKTLKEGGIVSMMFDQKIEDAHSVSTIFFNHPVRTLSTIAQLKLKFSPDVFPTFIARLPDGKYKIVMYETVNDSPAKNEITEETTTEMTQRYNNVLEELIREYPEQWFWMHNRWRLPK